MDLRLVLYHQSKQELFELQLFTVIFCCTLKHNHIYHFRSNETIQRKRSEAQQKRQESQEKKRQAWNAKESAKRKQKEEETMDRKVCHIIQSENLAFDIILSFQATDAEKNAMKLKASRDLDKASIEDNQRLIDIHNQTMSM